ncbi:Smr/MutS family protein [Pelagibacterales bacterium SAG-MED01]|nr:Smr/MutS family protein [Pelagibacterales bacterium SAG-MED01]
MNSKISDKDKKDWENFLSDSENLPDKDDQFIKNKIKKTITFDFHGYSLEEANKKIKDLIYKAYNQEVNKLIIVTGKGLHSKNDKDPYVSKDLGILKHSIPEFIKSDNELMSMINETQDANIKDGGSGAFYIFLKKKL